MFDDDVFSFAESDNLEELEHGLVYLEGLADKIQLVQGLTILKIENSGMWRRTHETLREYRIDQVARLGIPKQTVSDKRKIAQGYLACRDLLKNVSLRGRVSKLPDLPDVVDSFGQKVAMDLFMNASARDWQDKVREIRAARGPH
jgi:hypothetical protein